MIVHINTIVCCLNKFVCFTWLQMTRYKQADFVDEDTSSIGSIHLTESSNKPAMHIRYHTARVCLKLFFGFKLNNLFYRNNNWKQSTSCQKHFRNVCVF